MGGANYGQPKETSEILAFRSSAGISYRVSARLAIGMTASVIDNSNTLVMPYVFQSHPALKGLKTLLDLHTRGYGFNTSYGIMLRPTRRFLVSASYRTRSGITSTGTATGNLGAQLEALHIPFQPDFRYRAKVQVELPQAASLGASWQSSQAMRWSVESNWTNWHRSFATLPVSLTQGTNADVNGLLHSTSIQDTVPLSWKDQLSLRFGAERQLGERFSVAGGFSHQNNPVPASTLSPMTAAIGGNAISAGAGCRRGHARFDLAYQVGLPATQSVAKSSLLSGEFDHTRVRIVTQALTLTTTFGR